MIINKYNLPIINDIILNITKKIYIILLYLKLKVYVQAKVDKITNPIYYKMKYLNETIIVIFRV
jgi:hypothetical protein